MTALAAQPDIDFEALHAKVCPDASTLTPAQRDNREYPSAHDVMRFLTLLASAQYRMSKSAQTPICPAYYTAMNNGLLGKPIEKWADGSKYITHPLTRIGWQYLHALRRKLFTPIVAEPEPVDKALVVEGHWDDNPVEYALRNSLQAAMFAAYAAEQRDRRALMAGQG